MRYSAAVLVGLLLLAGLPAPTHAKENPAYKMAAQNADTLIEHYKEVSASGDPALVREAALAVQKNPLAVQRVNQNESHEFKRQISGDIAAVRTEAKLAAKKKLADHYGIHENRIDFMEAANPSDDPKLGQDWDVTAQVDGMAVPLDVAGPVIADTFYEAAKGHKAASPEEAARYAHSQSVEPINQESAEAYGSGGRVETMDPKTGEKKITTEGGDILAGDKSAGLRDPEHLGHVMEHKSDLAKNRADEARAQGLDDKAVGWDMEQARQYSKQEARQIQTRVEARGGEIPDHIQRGNAVLDDVASGAISPEEGRKRLSEIGETPESVIKKGTGLVEAADKLGTGPAERIAQAQSGKSPKDVFVDNVKEKMALKKLEREAQKIKEGPRESLLDGEGKSSSAHLEETLPDSRAEQVRDRTARAAGEMGLDAPKSLLDGGKASASHSDVRGTAESVQDTVDWTGWAVEAYHKEQRAAAEQGRGVNWVNVGKEAFSGLAAGKTYSISKKHSQTAVAQAKAKGENPFWTVPRTLLSAAGEFAHDSLTGVKNQHEAYQKEEMEKEIARAQQAGTAANAWRAKIPALMRIMGDVMQVNKITDWAADDSAEAVRAQAEMDRKLRTRAKAAVEVGLTEFGDLERRLRDELLKSEGSASEEVLALQKEYHEKMSALQDLRDGLFAKGLIDLQDPEWIAINQSANLLDSNVVETLKTEMKPVLDDQMHARTIREGIQNCEVTPVEGRLELIQNPELKAAVAAEVQSLRSQVAAFNQMIQQSTALEASHNLAGARAQLSQALEQCPCPGKKGPFFQRLEKLNERIAIQEKIAAADCGFLKDSVPAWSIARQQVECVCAPGTEAVREAGACVATVRAQLAAADCSHVPGSEPAYHQAQGAVVCQCPAGWLLDSRLNMCVADHERMRPEPVYEEPAQNSLFTMIQNINQQAYGSGANTGLNVGQMYAGMAAGGSGWSDPTNTASGSAFRPAGYATQRSGGQTAGFSSRGATREASSPTGGPGQGEF